MPAHRFPFTNELATEICDWISEGKTLREFCRQPGKPGYNTVYRWIDANLEFVDDLGFTRQFANAMETARLVGAHYISEECVEIADDATNDWIARTNPKSGETEMVFDKEHVQRSKLRIETRLKLLAKWHPKVYGEKVDVTSDGEKLASMPPVVNVIIDSDKPAEG